MILNKEIFYKMKALVLIKDICPRLLYVSFNKNHPFTYN